MGAIGAFFALRQTEKTEAPVPVNTEASRSRAPQVAVAPPRPIAANDRAKINSAKPLAALAAEFAQASSYKRFVDDRKSDPANGSFMFAAKALQVCSSALLDSQLAKKEVRSEGQRGNTGIADSGALTARASARRTLAHLCEGVRIGAEFNEMTVAAEGLASSDLFYAAAGAEPPFSIQAAKTQPHDMAALVAVASESSNPYAMAAALEVLSLPSVIQNLTFLGEPAAQMLPDRQIAIASALALLKCDFGADCGPQSPEVLVSCALSGACDVGSLSDIVRVEYERRSRRPDWALVESYRHRFGDAVRRGDRWLGVSAKW